MSIGAGAPGAAPRWRSARRGGPAACTRHPGGAVAGVASVAILLLFPASALAQFRVESRAVLVDVSVSRSGVPVEGLATTDFSLLARGESLEFRLLDRESLALAVLFAMDVSASTAGERQRRLAEGATLFAAALGDRDSCAVVTISIVARWLRRFAPCDPEVGARIRRTRAGGATALRDGILISLAALEGGAGRGVLVVFTDGDDNLSWAREERVLRSARATEALVYAVIAPPHRVSRSVDTDERGRRFLRRLTESSGGRAVRVEADRDLAGAFREILEELRVRYVLAFTPPLEHRGFVPLEVRVNRRGAEVRARTGYTARP